MMTFTSPPPHARANQRKNLWTCESHTFKKQDISVKKNSLWFKKHKSTPKTPTLARSFSMSKTQETVYLLTKSSARLEGYRRWTNSTFLRKHSSLYTNIAPQHTTFTLVTFTSPPPHSVGEPEDKSS